MEIDEKNRPLKKKELEEQREKLHAKLHSFKPKINADVPNFDALQTQFNEELEKRKESKPKTQPQEFSFLKKQADSQKTADEDDGMTENEREEAKQKALKMFEEEKKKKADLINSSLQRNYMPTVKKQVEAQKNIIDRNEKKLEELQKHTANIGSTKADLIREVITPKVLQTILTGDLKIDSLFKQSLAPVQEDPKENNGDLGFDNLFSGLTPTDEMGEQALPPGAQGPLFKVETVNEGDQSMPGAPRTHGPNAVASKKSPPKPEPPRLFSAKKPKVEVKQIDSASMKTKTQSEVARVKEEKAKELERQKAEEKRKEEEDKLKKKKATERVRFRLEDVAATQAPPPGDKGPTIGDQFKAVTQAFEESKQQMLEKVDKKACLVEESSLL
jgi:hypothetical protein